VDDHVARRGQLVEPLDSRHGLTGDHVHELNVWVSDHGPRHRPGGDRDLEAEAHAFVRQPRHLERLERRHRPLHGAGGVDGRSARVAREPAEDGVTTEADHVAAAAGALLDQRIEEAIEVSRYLFGPAPASQRRDQLHGQGREARDVCEEHAAVRPLRLGGEGAAPAVFWRVRPEDLGHVRSTGQSFHLWTVMLRPWRPNAHFAPIAWPSRLCEHLRVRRGVLLGFAPGSASGIGRFGYGLVLPLRQTELGLSLAQAGFVGSANTGGYLLGALLSHRLLGRIGYRRGVYASLFLQVLTLLALWLGPPYAVVLVLRLVQGVLGAFVFVGGAALLLASGARATAMGLYFGGMGVGLVLSTGTLPLASGWRASWGLLGVLALLMAVVAVAAARALKEPEPRKAEEGGEFARMAPALAVYALYGAGYIGYMTFVTSGLSAPLAPFWIVLGFGAMLTGLVWGRVADRLGCAGTLRP